MTIDEEWNKMHPEVRDHIHARFQRMELALGRDKGYWYNGKIQLDLYMRSLIWDPTWMTTTTPKKIKQLAESYG